MASAKSNHIDIAARRGEDERLDPSPIAIPAAPSVRWIRSPRLLHDCDRLSAYPTHAPAIGNNRYDIGLCLSVKGLPISPPSPEDGFSVLNEGRNVLVCFTPDRKRRTKNE